MQTVAYNTPPEPATDGPKRVRVLSEDEYAALVERAQIAESVEGGLRAELRQKELELSRRLGELKANREDLHRTIEEKRNAQDLYAQSVLARQGDRLRLVTLEKEISDEKAQHEALPARIANALRTWREHDQRCDENCVAVISLTAEQHRASLCRDLSDAAEIFVSAYDLLVEALHGGDDELMRVVSAALAAAINGKQRMARIPCGCDVAECDPCREHDCCTDPRKCCPECIREDAFHRRNDERHEARIAEGLR